MDRIRFSWDIPKAKANIQKHGISFEEAQTVFFDEMAIQFFDEIHSQSEPRFLLLGLSGNLKLLIVCHCIRETMGNETIIRLISARRATKTESAYYPGGNK